MGYLCARHFATRSSNVMTVSVADDFVTAAHLTCWHRVPNIGQSLSRRRDELQTAPNELIQVPRTRGSRKMGSEMPDTAQTSELKIGVFGFTPNELRMVEMVVRSAQRRTPRLGLVNNSDPRADVLLVDARDSKALRELRLADPQGVRPVVWVDGSVQKAGQQSIARPVQWSLLPMVLARAMEVQAAPSTPATQRTEPSSARVAADAASDVLVVDDSLPVRNFMAAALQPYNLRVAFAENGEQALALISRHSYLCVFLDVVMPGLDGYQVCRSIKNIKHAGRTPGIVMLTSKSSPFDKIRGTMSGCDAYMTKPVTNEDLLRLLARFVPRLASRTVESSKSVDLLARH
jgi:two-component system cell cycle response regulator